MRSIILGVGAAAGLMLSFSASPVEMPESAKKLKCDACHSIEKKIVGPAWMDVSKAYNSNGTTASGNKVSDILAGKTAEESLLIKVSEGGAGNWGTMPMPINARLFHPTSELGRRLNRIGFAGRFADPRKNITLLFDAVAVCHQRGVLVTCDLIGDEPRPEYAAYLNARNIAGSVAFLGSFNRTELVSHYNDLDLFVIPSHQEGLGIVGLEAMACGCPVVATRCGGTSDYVKDGVNGYLVGFSADEMADAIIRILSDAQLHRSLRAGALRTISENYGEAGVERVFWRQFDEVFGTGAN